MKNLLSIIVFLLFLLKNVVFSQEILYYPVTHHFLTRGDGTGGQDISLIPIIMDELNKAFLPAGIQFYMSCSGIDTIKNVKYLSHNSPHKT